MRIHFRGLSSVEKHPSDISTKLPEQTHLKSQYWTTFGCCIPWGDTFLYVSFFTMVTLTAFTNGLKKCRHDLVHYYALLSENLHATSCYCRRHPKTKWNKLHCVHSKEAQNTYLSNYNAFWQSHTWLILFCSFVCLAQINIILIPQGYFTGTGVIIWLFQCWWSNPIEYVN